MESTARPMTPEELTARCMSTVRSFRADRFDAYRHIETGEITNSGLLTFETCGHSYRWFPHGAVTNPKAGDVEMCATCLDNVLTTVTGYRNPQESKS